MKVFSAAVCIWTLVVAINDVGVAGKDRSTSNQHAQSNHYHLVYAACGAGSLEEVLVSLKSLWVAIEALPLSVEQDQYIIHVITDQEMQVEEVKRLQRKPLLEILGHAPKADAPHLFKPCSTQRLYLHEHPDFNDISEVLWLDADTLWLESMANVKDVFKEFNERRALVGMVVESTHAVPSESWYKARRGGDLPYYGESGLNAGVLLMSLDRIRNSAFSMERDSIVEVYMPQGRLVLGDQDVLNVLGHLHPEIVYELPCTYNFREFLGCYDGLPVILHGNGGLRNNLNSPYSSLYRVFARINTLTF